MGFGLLVIGYFLSTLMSQHAYGWATQIVGFYLIFLALGKLWEYKHSFKRCLVPLVLMTLCQAFVGFRHLFVDVPTTDMFVILEYFSIDDLINTIFVTILMVFHFLLLSSIHELALDVEDDILVKLARRNYYVVGVYFLFNITVAFLPKGVGVPTLPSGISVLTPISALASLIYPLFVLYLLYRCYARICAPEDKDMEQKPSRFAFINKMREKRKKSDETMDKLVEKLDPQENQKK
jgi:hypothetical protein